MRDRKKIVAALLGAAVIALTISFSAFAEENTRFVSGTSFNGVKVSGLTVEEAKAQIEGYFSGEYQLVIQRKDGKEETILGTDIGYQALVPGGLEEILAAQNERGRVSGPAANNSHTLSLQISYDSAALEAKLQALDCVSGEGMVQTENARISAYQEGQEFTIVPEVRGNSLDPEKTKAAIEEALKQGAGELNLLDAGCYESVQVSESDPALMQLCDTMNRYRAMTVTYQMGENTEVLGSERICSWLSTDGNGQLQVSAEGIAAFVQELAAKYDTAGTSRTFHTVSGRDVALTGPYGWKIDQAGEAAALSQLIASTTESQIKEPLYSQSAVRRSGSDWGNTYVEIDLTGQHVYMIQEGAVVWDAPCVTGNVAKNYTTPEGIYSLTYKEKDRILRGAKQADGSYEYESHVDYWMPFNGGIGLHDANWRGSFGGTIYQTSGSHGCVNLPPAKAAALYDLVYKGIPVICYN